MRKVTRFTCPKMALRWFIEAVSLIFSFCVAIIVFEDVILRIFAIFMIITSFYILIKYNGYGIAVFRSFIRVKIDSTGVSNAFCKIKWEEVQSIEYEYLEREYDAKYNRRIWFVTTKFGLVMFIKTVESENETTFKNYSLKNTICIPFDEKAKCAMQKFKGEVGDDSVSPRFLK